MHTIHIQKLGDTPSPCSTWFSIEKDDNISFICVCHTKNSTLTNTLHRICTDHVLELHPTEKNAVHVFTELLEGINHELEALYNQYHKTEISLFLWLVVGSHVHFSVFGKELTGIIVSSTNIEDIFNDMDTGEWHFVYDSHGDIRANETLYIFAPKVDSHVIWWECNKLSHLPLTNRCQLIAERIERSYVHDSIIMCIGEENPDQKNAWSTKKMHEVNKKGAVLIKNIQKVGASSIEKIQSQFSELSKNTQNWTLLGGLLLSIVLLYLIITSVIKSQYTLFVPQKYKDMVSEARVSLDDATRMVDQPDNFAPAMNRVREIVSQIKAAGVLQMDVTQLEWDMAVLERAVNKVTTLKPEDYSSVYTFKKNVNSIPFSIYSYGKKITLITESDIIGPFSPGEEPKSTIIPNDEKYTFSDSDTEGRIYLGTNKDKVYLYDKWLLSTINVGQVGWWDKAIGISVYNSNLYLLGTDMKQIYKYRRQSENSYSWRSFVINDAQTKQIVDMDVDGSVWLLSGGNQLGMEKILTAPRYERRPIIMNSLGTNSFQNVTPDTTKIYAGDLYQEIYVLADNRLWIFVPSSKRFSDVRNVTYVGQIDVPNTVITDLAIEQDGDVRRLYFWSPKSGIFTTKITVKDNKIHILPK